MTDQSKTIQELSEEVAALKERIRELEETEKELNLAKDTLREDMVNYQILAEMMTDVVWIQDLDLRTLYVSPSVEKMLGFAPSERLLQDVGEQLTPASLSVVYEAMARELALEQQGNADPDRTITIELEYYHKDGSTRWVENIISGVRNDRGELTGIHGVSRDITDRKQKEEAHRRSEEKFRHLFERAEEGITISRWGIIVLANPAFERILGYPMDKLTSEPFVTFFHPDDRAMVHERHLRRMRGESLERRRDYRIITADGTVRWVTISAQFIEWEGESANLSFIEDITDRKRAEEALRDSEHRYRSILGVLPDPLIESNIEGEYVDIHVAHEDSLVLPKRDLLGKTVYDVVPKEVANNIVECIRAALESQSLQSIEYGLDSSDGKKFFETRIMPSDNEKVVALVRDITRHRLAEAEILRLNRELEQRVIERTAQLELANREMESFAYSVSHDLRAPLRGIDGWSLALLEDYGEKLDDQARTYINRVRSETQLMGNLIDDVLRLSRVSRAELRVESLDLTAMAEGIAHRVQQEKQASPAEVIIQPDLHANGDRGLIDIALFNLFDNALKFTGGRSLARIEFGKTEVEGGETAFFIRDNGVGFAMAHAVNLFRPFHRLHKSREFSGTGIGLATVQRIIHRHGGRIWASAEPDKGATFFFTLEELP